MTRHLIFLMNKIKRQITHFYYRLKFLFSGNIKDIAYLNISPNKARTIPLAMRQLVLSKSKGICAYCPTELTPHNTTIDHIIPWKDVLTHSIDNLVACCRECNSLKGSINFKTDVYGKSFFKHQVKIKTHNGMSAVKGKNFKRQFILSLVKEEEKKYINNKISVQELFQNTKKMMREIYYTKSIQFSKQVKDKMKNENIYNTYKELTHQFNFKTHIPL